jgi:hypothetical protein
MIDRLVNGFLLACIALATGMLAGAALLNM